MNGLLAGPAQVLFQEHLHEEGLLLADVSRNAEGLNNRERDQLLLHKRSNQPGDVYNAPGIQLAELLELVRDGENEGQLMLLGLLDQGHGNVEVVRVVGRLLDAAVEEDPGYLSLLRPFEPKPHEPLECIHVVLTAH